MNSSTASSARTKLLFDEGWRFQLGDVADAESASFDDSAWRLVELPHDWSIELPRDPKAPCGGSGGFFQNGIGWYRKTLAVEPSWEGKCVALEFEGVYRNAEVFINGQRAGGQRYGYIPFSVDLTQVVSGAAAGQKITIAIRVDNKKQPSTRWYSGSGIYRHVWLHSFASAHIKTDTFKATTTALSTTEAVLHVEAQASGAKQGQALHAHFSVYGPDGTEATTVKVDTPNAAGHFCADLKIPAPRAWSPESPTLYRIVADLHDTATSTALDTVEVTTGLRTLAWSAKQGLLLNGQPIKLCGGNIHHDNGILGAAAFDRAEERKVELMKAAGFNAIRTAHNPHSVALLDICDRLGMLVMDEIFDVWEGKKTEEDYHKTFAEDHARDTEVWVRRDWNHPCIIFWSIGNEIMEKHTPEGVATAKKLAALVRSLDPTRPITAGMNDDWHKPDFWDSLDPFFAQLDIGGYNYQLDLREMGPGRPTPRDLSWATNHVRDHKRHPERIMVGTESFQYEVFANWRAARYHPYVLGEFVWTALDYLGETAIAVVSPPGVYAHSNWRMGGSWPWSGGCCGDIDLTGWRKPVSHYREIVWGGEREGAKKLYMVAEEPPPIEPRMLGGEVLRRIPPSGDTAADELAESTWQCTSWAMPPAFPFWDWPRSEGRKITVEVYSRYEAVRLYLNGQQVGEAPTGEAEEFKARFRVPYAAGELVAVGLQEGKERERFALKTAGPAVTLRATADRTKLRADGQDLAFITIEAVDAAGEWQAWANQEVSVQVAGAGALAALGTANVRDNHDRYTDSHCTLFQGRALAIVRTGHQVGPISVRISAPGLAVADLVLNAQ